MTSCTKRVCSSTFAALATLFVTSQASAQSAPEGMRVLTLDDCVATALSSNVDARSSALEVDAASTTRTGSRSELLPHLKADGALQQWDSAFELPFALPGASGPPPVLTVRDAFTWTAGATI